VKLRMIRAPQMTRKRVPVLKPTDPVHFFASLRLCARLFLFEP
jgi:hypothetical protein